MAKKNSQWKMEENFYLSQDQTQKKRYVGTKSDHWGLRYGPAKFVRIWWGLLARGLIWTLNRRSFSHTDRILLQHISFLASGPDLNKSFSQLFTQNFFWLFPPSFSKNGKKSENFSLESRDLNSANPQVAIFNSAADYSVRVSDRELWAQILASEKRGPRFRDLDISVA